MHDYLEAIRRLNDTLRHRYPVHQPPVLCAMALTHPNAGGKQQDMKARKSWREKLATSKDLPKTLVIPAPREVDEIMARVPEGKLTTIDDIRRCLARKHNTDTTCPLTTGIFAWIAAHAAVEGAAAGETNTTPYWRTLKSGGQINPKYPGGVKTQVRLLKSEGHKIVRKGQQFFVADYEKSLFA